MMHQGMLMPPHMMQGMDMNPYYMPVGATAGAYYGGFPYQVWAFSSFVVKFTHVVK